MTFTSPLIPGTTATVEVTASIAGSVLNAWIDFNADGDWDDLVGGVSERIFSDVVLSNAAPTPNVLNFTVPTGAAEATESYARFRLSTVDSVTGSYGYDGEAPDGEVEDYEVVLQPAPFEGTSGNDVFVFKVDSALNRYLVKAGGAWTIFNDPAVASVFSFDGKGGEDSIIIYGGDADETATGSHKSIDVTGWVTVGGPAYEMHGEEIENITVFAEGGSNNRVTLNDTTDDNKFYGYYDTAWMTYPGGDRCKVLGFNDVNAQATTGFDRAYMYGWDVDDALTAAEDIVSLVGTEPGTGTPVYDNSASGFVYVFAYAGTGGGTDTAAFSGSAGADTFRGTTDVSWLRYEGSGRKNHAFGFSEVAADAGAAGDDLAYFLDSAGDDAFTVRMIGGSVMEAEMAWPGVMATVTGFGRVAASATETTAGNGGSDTATFEGHFATDRFYGYPHRALLYYGNGPYAYANRFEAVSATAGGGGGGTAYLIDSAGDDTFTARSGVASMSGPTGGGPVGSDAFNNEAHGFATVSARSWQGVDTANFYDSGGDDGFASKYTASWMDYANGDFYWAHQYEQVNAYAGSAPGGSGGNDTTWVYDSTGDDSYEGWLIEPGGGNPDYTLGVMDRQNGATSQTRVAGFTDTRVYATEGGDGDEAHLHDSSGNDVFKGFSVKRWMEYASGDQHWTNKFESVYADASTDTGGSGDQAVFHDTDGDDTFTAKDHPAGDYGEMSDAGGTYYNWVRGFDQVEANSHGTGTDTLNRPSDLNVLDYVLSYVALEWSTINLIPSAPAAVLETSSLPTAEAASTMRAEGVGSGSQEEVLAANLDWLLQSAKASERNETAGRYSLFPDLVDKLLATYW